MIVLVLWSSVPYKDIRIVRRSVMEPSSGHPERFIGLLPRPKGFFGFCSTFILRVCQCESCDMDIYARLDANEEA